MKMITTEMKSFVPPPALLRLAREQLGWTVSTAAKVSSLTETQVLGLETDPRGGVGLFSLEGAYQAAGIEFKAFTGPSGQIFKTRLNGGAWRHCTRRGPLVSNLKG